MYMLKEKDIGGNVYMEKKAIVFDLDETLRKLDFNLDYNKIVNVRLRPKISVLDLSTSSLTAFCFVLF